MKQKILILAGLAVMLFFLAACGAKSTQSNLTGENVKPKEEGGQNSEKAADSGGTIKIGLSVPLAGAGYEAAQQSIAAAEIAVEEINSKGGILGKKVELVVKDMKGDVQIANRTAQELIDKDNVMAIVGGGSSATTQAISFVVKDSRVPFIASSGNSQTIFTEKGHEFIFNTTPNSGMEARAIARYAYDQGWRKFAAIVPDYEWGQVQVKTFTDFFEKLAPGQSSLEAIWFKAGETDYSRYITQLQNMKVDAILVYAWGGDNVSFTKQAKQFGLFNKGIPMIGYWMFDALLPLGKEAPEGVIGFERAPFPYLSKKYPLTEKFVKSFHAKTGKYPSGYALMTYDSFLALEKAANEAKSTEREAIAKTLAGMSFESTRGQVTFRKIDGQLSVPVFFGTVFQDKELGIPSFKNVVEVPADQVWLSEEQVMAARK